MKISNLGESVVFDYGPKKYTASKGYMSIRLVSNVFYVNSVEENNKFNIKFLYSDVSLPQTTSALELQKLLQSWNRSGGSVNTDLEVDDDYLYFTNPSGIKKRIAGSRYT